MMRLHPLAVALIVIEAFMVAVISKRYGFPAAAAGIAFASFISPWAIPPFRHRQAFIYLALAIVYTVKLQLIPGLPASTSVALGNFGHPLAQYFISVQVVGLFLRDSQGLKASFPLLGILACSFAGDSIVGLSEHRMYHAGALAYITVAVLFYTSLQKTVEETSNRRARNWALAAILTLVLSLGSVNSMLLKRNQQDLDDLFNSLAYARTSVSGPGFSQRARLESINIRKRTEGNKTALRIYGERAPGYLRGKAYDVYDAAEWVVAASSRPLGAVPVFSDEEGNFEDRFVIRETTSRPTTAYTIWRDGSLGKTLFAPLNMAQLAGSMATVIVNDHRIAVGENSTRTRPYRAYTGKTVFPEPLTADQLQLFTLLPDSLDPRVRDLAESLFENRETTPEKVAAVISYFHGNYEYAVGIGIPPGVDPLTHFLLEQPPAHCEYFATGAAVLLRLGGVPCRYVTGFVSREHNAVGDYWLARNKDAHAWVEAYDESKGWFIVETTPPLGVPSAREAGAYAYWWDSMKQNLKELRHALTTGAIGDLLKKMFALVMSTVVTLGTTLPGISLLSLLAMTGLWRMAGRLRGRWKRPPDEFEELHDLLKLMDKRVKRFGAARQPTETISHFASRLREEFPEHPTVRTAVAWYRDYAALRFDPAADKGMAQNLLRRLHERV